MNDEIDQQVHRRNLLAVVNSGVDILDVSARARHEDEDEELNIAFEVDLVISDTAPFLGASLKVQGAGVQIKVLGATSIISPNDGNDESEFHSEDYADLLRKRPIAVHNLYDALAVAARSAAASLARMVDVPQLTPEATISVMEIEPSEDAKVD